MITRAANSQRHIKSTIRCGYGHKTQFVTWRHYERQRHVPPRVGHVSLRFAKQRCLRAPNWSPKVDHSRSRSASRTPNLKFSRCKNKFLYCEMYTVSVTSCFINFKLYLGNDSKFIRTSSVRFQSILKLVRI